jgi:PAS domain S-box-containing protein
MKNLIWSTLTFEKLAEKLPVGVLIGSTDTFIYVNPRFAEIHGYSVEELLREKQPSDLVYPPDLPLLEQHFRKAVSEKCDPGVAAFRSVKKNGEIMYVENHDFHFLTIGERDFMMGIVVDVTERKRNEEEIRKYQKGLEELVEERTSELASLNEELLQDIEKRKVAERALEIKSRNLEEVNTALKVLLQQREDDRKELEGTISSNVKGLVLQYIQMLKESRLDTNQRLLVDIIEQNLDQFLSSFCKKIMTFDFTPKEMEVILLINEGRTTKQMSRLLNVTRDAVNRHRYHIRKKLGLNRNKANLRMHLLKLAEKAQLGEEP